MSIVDEIRESKDKGRLPRVHPNGFLQLDLRPDPSGERVAKRRLHIFEDELPRQATRTPLHDHIFDMSSFVYQGMILNDTYIALPAFEGPFEIYQARDLTGAETKLEPTGKLVTAVLKRTEYVYRGESYNFPALTFHESRYQGRTVTIMSKRATAHTAQPRVLVPRDREPDNDFSREDQDIENLWALIEETFECAL